MGKSRDYVIGFVVSLLGFIDALYTLWHRQNIFAKGLQESSFCNFGENANCDAVAFSKYSSLFGVPTSAWGLVFFSALIILFIAALISHADKKEKELKNYHSWLFSISLIGLIPVFAYSYISFFVLNTFCIMCVAFYIITAFLVFWTWKIWRSGQSSFVPKTFPATTWILSFAAMTALSLFLPQVFQRAAGQKKKIGSKQISIYVNDYKQNKQHDLSIDQSPISGPKSAPVTVVEYSDFQCPYCGVMSQTLPAVLQQFKGKVKFVYKYFPLDSACNPFVNNAMHPLACYAAKASHCVFKLKGNQEFWPYKKLLFKHQNDLSRPFIDEEAMKLGLSKEEYDSCVKSSETHDSVVRDIKEGQRIGVSGTPAIYVNGRQLRAAMIPEILRSVIESEL